MLHMPATQKSDVPPFCAAFLAAALLFAPALHAVAQSPVTSPPASASPNDQTTGVSHPELLHDNIDAPQSTQIYAPGPAKPSPDVPLDTATTPAQAAPSGSTYSDTYVPYQPTLQQRPAAAGDHYIPPSRDPGSSNGSSPQPSTQAFVADDVNSGVVTEVASGPNELPIGTRINAALESTISTVDTPAGSLFTATLSAPLMHQGRVLVPAGSTIQGRITRIHGGRRISGLSAIRLQPDTLVLPDHTFFRIDAEVVDLDNFRGSHVSGEGTIVANTNKAATAAAIGLTTTSATVAGAVIGGGVGAVVGAGVGAGIGTIWWLRQDHEQTLPAGTQITLGLNEPLIITPANAAN